MLDLNLPTPLSYVDVIVESIHGEAFMRCEQMPPGKPERTDGRWVVRVTADRDGDGTYSLAREVDDLAVARAAAAELLTRGWRVELTPADDAAEVKRVTR